MSLRKPLSRVLFLITILFITIQTSSFAQGGFPVRPGRLLITPAVSYFFANSQWDSVGVLKPFPRGGQFSSYGITLHSEFGISRRFAAVATLPYVINNYQQDSVPRNTMTSGLTDLETGIKFYAFNIDFIYYFSIQATAITPMYTNNASLGYGEEGGELKLAFSGTGHLFDRSTYFNLEDGVRQYFGTNGPIQDRYSGTFGITLDEDFLNQISVTASGIYSQSNDKGFSPVHALSNKDFNFFQVALSYGHTFTPEISVFVSGGKFLTGRNTGDGYIASLAFIYRLDYR
jgi:hypothetical protein